MKKILSLLLVSSSIFSMQLDIAKSDQKHSKMYIDQALKKVRIDPSSVHASYTLGDVALYHGKKGFVVRQDDKKYVINECFMDSTARNLTREQLATFLTTGYFALNQANDGTFLLKAHQRVVGGGVIGASIGAFLGKAAVYVIGHGAIQIVAICTGPAYPVTVLALEGCFAVPIEAASMAGAIAGGMALGVATGPV